MQDIIDVESFHEDYSQSANSLFHFMQEQRFLNLALTKKALYPRYCIEDISYLKLVNQEIQFNDIAVLQKCFCDIPLHKVASSTEAKVEGLGNGNNTFFDTSHTGCYGKFAVAFSKAWGEKKGLQPVQYLNEDSPYVNEFKVLFEKVVSTDGLPREVYLDLLQRIAYMKPLRGKMERVIKINGTPQNVCVYKNFHDEKEWRYVPRQEKLMEISKGAETNLGVIIANPYEVAMRKDGFFDKQSQTFEEPPYDLVRLEFDYSELRYIIVPNEQSRLDTIALIMELPDERFQKNAKMERNLLISKILVLEEIRKDW